MYQPERYKNDDFSFIYPFIKEHPFATIVLKGDFLLATHVPILIDENAKDFTLYAHIANHNPMRKFLVDGAEMLLIFKGPDAYVSSSWYSEPEIPTWDYTAVHINARVELQTDKELEESLVNLIDCSEKSINGSLQARDIPEDIWKENFPDITGFWLHPFRQVGVEKLHQTFSEEDIDNVTQNLRKQGGCPHTSLAQLIEEKNKTLKKN